MKGRSKMYKEIEIQRGDIWEKAKFEDIKAGDTFKNSGLVMTAASDAFPKPENNFPGNWAVKTTGKAKPYKTDSIMTGSALIAIERARQKDQEGWTPEHDEEHDENELALAAACYAMPDQMRSIFNLRKRLWPWSPDWWKPTPDNRIKELVKAGALIAAEIDRIQREKNSI